MYRELDSRRVKIGNWSMLSLRLGGRRNQSKHLRQQDDGGKSCQQEFRQTQ